MELQSETMVLNPKRERKGPTGRASWYPYYASFSQSFARGLIASINLSPKSRIMDPWNGSGTTIAAATSEGHLGFGFDINPVMVIAARARLLGRASKESIQPLVSEICIRAGNSRPSTHVGRREPLSAWLGEASCVSIRRIEGAIQHLLVKTNFCSLLTDAASVNELSDLASFFYVALFRTLRRLLASFFATNPTWVKKPCSNQGRLRPSFDNAVNVFRGEVTAMVQALDQELEPSENCSALVSIASSDSIPTRQGTIDCVLTSPPYCTRIDYAVATSIELALLGIDSENGFNQLRRSMIGTSTVLPSPPSISNLWGETCLNFLEDVSKHPSKASAGYYLKNHLQYFDGMFKSFKEISRVIKRGGLCILVVQDSHYKEVRNNLPQICIEMCESSGFSFQKKVDFEQMNTMAGRNPRTRQYRFNACATESVVFLDRM